MKQDFSNADLKAGMYVELKNGETGILIPTNYSNPGGLSVVGYSRGSDNLTLLCKPVLANNNSSSSGYEIVKVYGRKNDNTGDFISSESRELLWNFNTKYITHRELERLYGCTVVIVEE